MGLDMYLNGERFLHGIGKPERRRGEIKSEIYDLGYWRKHPNLHGYIVDTFADGRDECQRIDLSGEDIRRIMTAVEVGALPETTGFFFGSSDGSEKPEDLRIFREALAWLEVEDEGGWRSVYYRASW